VSDDYGELKERLDATVDRLDGTTKRIEEAIQNIRDELEWFGIRLEQLEDAVDGLEK
jgi:hypothetical protein